MIELVAAKDLRKGDVFSTDGGVVESVVSLKGGEAPDKIAVQVICHGIEKFAYLEPNHPCPLWRGTPPTLETPGTNGEPSFREYDL